MPSNYQPKHANCKEFTTLTFTTRRASYETDAAPYTTLGSVLNYSDTDDYIDGADETLRGADALRHLADVLTAIGCPATVYENMPHGDVVLNICHPTVEDAQALRSRNAGRKPKQTANGSPLDNLTPSERLQWLYSHTPEEGCDALGGVSTRTRKRRIAELRRECQS